MSHQHSFGTDVVEHCTHLDGHSVEVVTAEIKASNIGAWCKAASDLFYSFFMWTVFDTDHASCYHLHIPSLAHHPVSRTEPEELVQWSEFHCCHWIYSQDPKKSPFLPLILSFSCFSINSTALPSQITESTRSVAPLHLWELCHLTSIGVLACIIH